MTDTTSAEITIPADSQWFEGHFPNDPILPGVAQLALVAELIKQKFDPVGGLSAVKRVRFRQIVRPADRLKITITRNCNTLSGFNFSITCQDRTVCSGLLIMDDFTNT